MKDKSVIKVSLDLDGVLANLHSAVLPAYSAIGKPVLPSDVKDWATVPVELYVHAWTKFGWENIDPYEASAGRIIEEFSDRFETSIVTAHTEESRENIEQWLKHWGINVPLVLSGTINKSVLLYSAYIDDHPRLAEHIAKMPTKSLALIDRPYNRNLTGKPTISPNIFRAKHLIQAYETLTIIHHED